MPQQPAPKLRKGGIGKAQRPTECFLCHKTGHMASNCPNRGIGGAKRAFQLNSASYAFGCCERHAGSEGQTLPTECPTGNIDREQWSQAFGAHDYNALQEDEDYLPDFVSERGEDPQTRGANSWVSHKFGILDSGATSTCASVEVVQLIADAWEPLERYPDLEPCDKNFIFAGEEQAHSKTRAWMPNEIFTDGIAVSTVECSSTPLLIGADMLRYYGLVLDYGYDTVYSHRLKRDVPCTRLPS